MKIGIVSLFPEMFAALDYGICGRALKQGLLSLRIINPRDFTEDLHHTVDDRPYGGGPGMVMQAVPLCKAIEQAKVDIGGQAKVVYLSPQGKTVTQDDVRMLATRANMILIAGRYEGIDERIIESTVDEEWSIGDYILSGGELAAMVLIDAITRLLPGALGHAESAQQDSFMAGLLDCPHYTRPEEVFGKRVPSVLLSGHHQAIKRWRMKQSLGRTLLRRPDLLAKLDLDAEQQRLLAEFIEEQQK